MSLKNLFILFVIGFAVNSCKEQPGELSKTLEHQSNKLQSVPRTVTELPKEIFIMIGRGYCCNGHIISISKNGEIKYFVGTYSIPNDESEMPEIYDPEQIRSTSAYKMKAFKLSSERINHLEKLISNEQGLNFNEDLPTIDDYVYSIYLDNKKIASGAQSRKDKFPENLKALIDLIHEEVELYELPGMA